MNPVLRAPPFAPITTLRLRRGCLSQPTRTAGSCANLNYLRNLVAPCPPFTALLKWGVVECAAAQDFEWIPRGWQTFGFTITRLASGLSSSKEAQRCFSAVAASLSPIVSPEDDSASGSSEGQKIDLNLPRRRLQLSFTCDACGTRSQRLINPDAYARGTVFVQCAGCEVYHKLVDNLGLIEEYDFRKEKVEEYDFRQETSGKADGADLNVL